jgi:hypothetical protein
MLQNNPMELLGRVFEIILFCTPLFPPNFIFSSSTSI